MLRTDFLSARKRSGGWRSLAGQVGSRSILIPGENKRDVADVPNAMLTAINWQFCSPTNASILALGRDG